MGVGRDLPRSLGRPLRPEIGVPSPIQRESCHSPRQLSLPSPTKLATPRNTAQRGRRINVTWRDRSAAADGSCRVVSTETDHAACPAVRWSARCHARRCCAVGVATRPRKTAGRQLRPAPGQPPLGCLWRPSRQGYRQYALDCCGVREFAASEVVWDGVERKDAGHSATRR